MKKRSYKYCPKCGKSADINDAYCMRCGYNFKGGKRSKKISLKQILLGILILAAAWVIIRLITKQPIIPLQVSEFFKGFIEGITGTNSSKQS